MRFVAHYGTFDLILWHTFNFVAHCGTLFILGQTFRFVAHCVTLFVGVSLEETWEGAGKRRMRREERGMEQKNAGSSGGTLAETGGSTGGSGGTQAATRGWQRYGSTE